MSSDLSARIERMFRLDRLWAWAFVVVLWCVVGFVLFMIYPLAAEEGVGAVLIAAALVLVAFNTASMGAMVRHYAHDKEFIYSLDIRHLDEGRRVRAMLVQQPAE